MSSRRSSAPELVIAELVEPEKPRAKRLRVQVEDTVASAAEARRKEASNRVAALKLYQLRRETGLTQVDAAVLGCVSSRTVGSYERGDVDLTPLRLYLELQDLRAEQLGRRRG